MTVAKSLKTKSIRLSSGKNADKGFSYSILRSINFPLKMLKASLTQVH